MNSCLILGGGVSGRAAQRLASLLSLTPELLSDGPQIDADAVTAQRSLIVASPGVKPLSSPLWQAAKRRADTGECEFISELEFGFRHLPEPHRCLAITGTNGKTTTTELTVHLLRALGVDAVPAGNIGFPLSDVAADILEGKSSPAVLPVVEVSSFQLELIYDFAPLAGVLLNLESDHEDRYAGGFAEYAAVKRSMFRRIAPENRIAGLSCPEPAAPRRVTVNGDALFLDGSALLTLPETRLNAPHNRENLAAAVELVVRVVPAERLRTPDFVAAVRAFHPGAHRLEAIQCGEITCINDSKATNPASVVAALRSLPTAARPNIVLLLGGLDKGMDFSSLTAFGTQVKQVILFGQCREKIAAALHGVYPAADCGMDFEAACRAAQAAAAAGDVILLSPACASMDLFRDYKERGSRFLAFFSGEKPAGA